MNRKWNMVILCVFSKNFGGRWSQGWFGGLPRILGTWVYPSSFVSNFSPIGEVTVAPYISHVLRGRPRSGTGKELRILSHDENIFFSSLIKQSLS